VSAFQPFESRVGVDTVLKLEFRYDAGLIATLKDAIGRARHTVGGKNLGGWLPEHKVWFVERRAWEVVRRHLLAAGCQLVGPEEDEDHAAGADLSSGTTLPRRAGRQPLPMAVAAPPSSVAIPIPTTANLVKRAIAELNHVRDRAGEMMRELRETPPEHSVVVTVLSAAIAANANLSSENIASLTDAVRQGKLPRKRIA
jgi:hypothetical protein